MTLPAHTFPLPFPVAPAKAGVPLCRQTQRRKKSGVPAFAGMTGVEGKEVAERAASLRLFSAPSRLRAKLKWHNALDIVNHLGYVIAAP